jgi:hypothetical protein
MIRTFALAGWLLSAVAFAQEAAPAPQPQFQGKMPHLRIYLGAAGVQQQSSGSGGAIVLGVQGYSDMMPFLSWYWAAELIGARVGPIVLPVTNGDIGVRWTPFPTWLLRPYLRANVGLSFLLFLPVPSTGVGLGISLPVLDLVYLDAVVGVRRAFAIWDASQSLDLQLLELSVGF